MSRKTPETPPEQSSLVRAMLVPGLLFAGIIVLAVVIGVFGNQASSGNNTSGPAAADNKTLETATMRRFGEEWDEVGVAVGPADAPVTVREFADYQCPACGAFFDVAKRIRDKYVASGQVRFIFFDFPLRMHDHAREAAAAARCAGRQDGYWAFHEQLYRNQQSWSQKTDPTSTFLDYAVTSGIKAEPVRRCLEQGATDQIVSRSAEIAKKVGIRSTPTVIVGSRMFEGVTDYDTLASAIETRLAEGQSQ